MHARFEPLEHGAHAWAVLWTLRPALGRECRDHQIAMTSLRELWPKPIAGAHESRYPLHTLKGAALMHELPEQESKGIDICAVLQADERAAQAEADAAAATAVATIAALERVTAQLLHLFGRQIPQCARHRIRASMTCVVQAEARQTKVGELAHRVLRVEQCIIRLDIVVQDAVRVEEAQPARQLQGEANLLVV